MAYTPTVPYADEDYADAYFAERLRSDPYTEACTDDKVKALQMATRAIDQLNFAGDKADEAQLRQFPRGEDTEVPDPIMQACCELALALLDDVDPNLEVENLNRAAQGVGDARIQRFDYAQDHVRSGIPSIQAWILLCPFLRDTRILDMDRS